MDLARIEERAKNGRREVAAIAPESRLHAARFARDEAGDDERAVKAFVNDLTQALARLRPLDCRSQRPPFHTHHSPCVDPLHRTRAHPALFKVLIEKLGRPELPITCN